MQTLIQTLEDIDYADDIALLSHRNQDIQGKTEDLEKYGKQIGLNINSEKTKLMKLNPKINQPLVINNTCGGSTGIHLSWKQDNSRWRLRGRC